MSERIAKEVFNVIDKYAKELMSEEFTMITNPQILIKYAGECYKTSPNCDLKNLNVEDIGLCAENNTIEEDLLSSSKEINAIVLSNTPYLMKTNKLNKTIVAVVDDMAQIVGYKVEVVPYTKEAIRKALKKSTACIVSDKYTISTGRSLYEACVALGVLEKSAEINLKVEAIGGAKKIPTWEAKLMRFVYKKKYSKAETVVKTKEVSNGK